MNNEEIKKDLLETGGFAKMQHHYRGYFNNDLDYFIFCLTNLLDAKMSEYVNINDEKSSKEILVNGLNEMESNRLLLEFRHSNIPEGVDNIRGLSSVIINISIAGKKPINLDYELDSTSDDMPRIIPHAIRSITNIRNNSRSPIEKKYSVPFGTLHYMMDDGIVYIEEYLELYRNLHVLIKAALKDFKGNFKKDFQSLFTQSGVHKTNDDIIIKYVIKNHNDPTKIREPFLLFRIKEIGNLDNSNEKFIDLEVTCVDKLTLKNIDKYHKHNVGILEHADY